MLANSKHNAYEQAGIEEVIRLVDNNEATLITSVITRIEILSGKLTDDITNKYLDTEKTLYHQDVP